MFDKKHDLNYFMQRNVPTQYFVLINLNLLFASIPMYVLP